MAYICVYIIHIPGVYIILSPTSDESRPLIAQLARVYDLLSPTSDESRPLIGQLARVYDLVFRGKSCMSG